MHQVLVYAWEGFGIAGLGLLTGMVIGCAAYWARTFWGRWKTDFPKSSSNIAYEILTDKHHELQSKYQVLHKQYLDTKEMFYKLSSDRLMNTEAKIFSMNYAPKWLELELRGNGHWENASHWEKLEDEYLVWSYNGCCHSYKEVKMN